jgi:HlyD family secretion protein
VQRFLILFLSIFFMVGCASQASFGDAVTEGEPTPFPTSVIPSRPVYDVERGDVIDQRTYFGRVSSIVTEPLMFELDGRIAEVYVSNGADVVAGDVLAVLDTTELESLLLTAEEELAVAQSLLDTARNQLEIERRRASLGIDLAQINLDLTRLRAAEPPTDEENLLIRQAEIELDLARLDLEEVEDGVDAALQFDVFRAEEEVDNLNAQIAKATLISPLTGRIISFLVDDYAAVTAFETIGIVADLTLLEVTNTVDNIELSALSQGLPALIQRSDAPDEVFEGTVVLIPQPFGSGNDGLVHIRFNVQPSEGEFALGDRMIYTVIIAERHDVLWLPVVAIRQFSGRNFVVIQENGVERRVDVQLGLQGNDRVEIIAGLEEGQRVIAP